ncbi:MAG: RagB/SusD family nutrient uptake outer membrane protein [Rhodothermales bacterium]
MYQEGLILDEADQTEADYQSREAIIAESNRQLDLAIENAAGFDAIRTDVIPDLFVDSEVGKPTSASLAAAARTLQARNQLVNTSKDAITEADWQAIADLTAEGLQDNANTFILRTDNVTFPNGIFFAGIIQGAHGPFGWHRVSERLMQDVQPDDARLANFEFTVNEAGEGESWSTRGRGIQYNSRWRLHPDGSRYASESATEDEVKWYFVSAEENKLMRAEALLALGDAAGAAALVDEVRAMQNAGLPSVDSSSDVWAQIRSERRIGLFLRALAFYDARRWGLIAPVTEGGGRANAVVVENDNSVSTDATINYNFLPYWPIPDEELTFNRPGGGGEPGNPS